MTRFADRCLDEPASLNHPPRTGRASLDTSPCARVTKAHVGNSLEIRPRLHVYRDRILTAREF